MIDIYARKGTFTDPVKLARDAADTITTIEAVPDVPMFRKNTAAFIHEDASIANVDGDERLKERTWVLLTEASPGGWGLGGHAHTNEELVVAARAEIARFNG